jgi:hypothetical protein
MLAGCLAAWHMQHKFGKTDDVQSVVSDDG